MESSGFCYIQSNINFRRVRIATIKPFRRLSSGYSSQSSASITISNWSPPVIPPAVFRRTASFISPYVFGNMSFADPD